MHDFPSATHHYFVGGDLSNMLRPKTVCSRVVGMSLVYPTLMSQPAEHRSATIASFWQFVLHEYSRSFACRNLFMLDV